MKKILFLLLLVSAVSTKAQTYDETQLTGTWQVSSISGKLPLGIESFTGFIFEETQNMYGEWNSGMMTDVKYGEGDDEIVVHPKKRREDSHYDNSNEYLLDYFISNGNKLHIIVDDQFSFKFIIEELTASTIRLKTYNGQCVLSLSKDGTNSVRSASKTLSTDASTYNFGGQKVENVTGNGVYIQNGQKKVVKR